MKDQSKLLNIFMSLLYIFTLLPIQCFMRGLNT